MKAILQTCFAECRNKAQDSFARLNCIAGIIGIFVNYFPWCLHGKDLGPMPSQEHVTEKGWQCMPTRLPTRT